MASTAFALSLGNGLTIAGQRWSSRLPTATSKGLVVAVHGWLDNSSSFNRLAPALVERGYDVAAVDLPGHGLSSHMSSTNCSNSHYNFPFNISALKRFVDLYTASSSSSSSGGSGSGGSSSGGSSGSSNESRLLYLLGHSMGAGISLMAAGAFPEICTKVVLIDGFGPYAREGDASCDSFRKAAAAEHRVWEGGSRRRKRYTSIDAAVDARLKAVAGYPGNQSMSLEAAQMLVLRGTEAIEDEEGGVYFRHDPRLTAPSYNYYTNKQVDSFVRCVRVPVLLLTAERGWPPIAREDLRRRADILADKGLLSECTLPGSHHLHLDASTSGPVEQAVGAFLDRG